MSLYILILSLLTGVLTSYVSFQNPQLRWQQLRAAALEIEAEIFSFRTRTGKYRAQSSKSTFTHTDQIIFQQHLKSVQERVLESADLKKTSFFSTNKSLQCKHGQHPPPRVTFKRKSTADDVPGLDDHHSPVQPNEYIKIRLDRESEFYKSRVPFYGRVSNICQAVIVLSSIFQSCLAFFAISSWAALISAFAAAVTAWISYSSVRDKLERYSNTINALEDIKIWWEALPQAEQQTVQNVDNLIGTVEDILRTERSAWYAAMIDVKTKLGGFSEGGDDDDTSLDEDRNKGKKGRGGGHV